MKKYKLALAVLLPLILTTFSIRLFAQDHEYEYAYVSVEGKLFSKKLKVDVDFGDTPEQIKVGKDYSEILTNKKSFAAILNYMVKNGFELVETLDFNSTSQGTGETSGIGFIMRKKQ